MAMKITSENFETEVIESNEPVLLDFWAERCAPCRMLGPVIDEIADENKDIKVGKVNVDEEPQLSTMFDVSAIPTLVCFKGGKAVGKIIGVQSKSEILKMVADSNGN